MGVVLQRKLTFCRASYIIINKYKYFPLYG